MPINSKYIEDYDLPDNRDQFVDVTKGEVVDRDSIPVIEVIKAVAKKIGCEVCDPLPGHRACQGGRGYVGLDSKTKAPIPCKCIFRKNKNPEQAYHNMMAESAYGGWNREKRRKIFKEMKRRKKLEKRKNNNG